MTKTRTTPYDVADHLRTPEDMAAYLEACLEEAPGDATLITEALGDIARAKGMSQVARDSGLSRERLHRALSGDRSPDFGTILKIIEALGLKLHARTDDESHSQRSPGRERAGRRTASIMKHQPSWQELNDRT